MLVSTVDKQRNFLSFGPVKKVKPGTILMIPHAQRRLLQSICSIHHNIYRSFTHRFSFMPTQMYIFHCHQVKIVPNKSSLKIYGGQCSNAKQVQSKVLFFRMITLILTEYLKIRYSIFQALDTIRVKKEKQETIHTTSFLVLVLSLKSRIYAVCISQ